MQPSHIFPIPIAFRPGEWIARVRYTLEVLGRPPGPRSYADWLCVLCVRVRVRVCVCVCAYAPGYFSSSIPKVKAPCTPTLIVRHQPKFPDRSPVASTSTLV
jgi:hypothetical protein